MGASVSFIHAGRGIQYAWRVGGIDLERGVVRGDQRPGARLQKVAGNGHGQRGAFFGIGGGAKLVEQNQRLLAGQPGEPVEIGDVRGKSGERGFDGLRIADVGQERCEDRKAGRLGGNGQSSLGHHGQQSRGLERDGFAAGVGAADDELAILGGEFQGERDNSAAARAQALFQQRMARCLKTQQIRRDAGATQS